MAVEPSGGTAWRQRCEVVWEQRIWFMGSWRSEPGVGRCRFAGDQVGRDGAVAVRDAEIKSIGGTKLCDVVTSGKGPAPTSGLGVHSEAGPGARDPMRLSISGPSEGFSEDTVPLPWQCMWACSMTHIGT